MKHFLSFILSFFVLTAAPILLKARVTAQENFYTDGNRIFDPCGHEFIPRGVNYALLDDWDFPGNLNSGELSAQIIQANPNTVRIQWYVDYGQPSRPAYSLTDLDSVISRFERAGIVSILEMHDVTCTDNYNGFQNIINYWTGPAMVALINRHGKSMMLNVANEYKQVEWTVNANAAFTEYENDYISAIHSIRNAGIRVPIIIDAPDCGISINRLLDAASDFYIEDNLHNIILSDHAYYYANTETMMSDLADQAANCPIPVIFGEIANIQDATGPCSDTITYYPALLTACQNKSIGWLAWVWTDDMCNGRRVSSNGMFTGLTAYGNDIVNNTAYGLSGHAPKACFETGTAIASAERNKHSVNIYPNPANDVVNIQTPGNVQPHSLKITFRNAAGQIMNTQKLSANSSPNIKFDIGDWPAGIYWLRYTDGNTVCRKIFIKE